MRLLRKSIFYFLFFISLICIGQQYNFKKYSTKNGLANSSINNIYQDSKGYLWFATQGGGISRFDGKEFKNFTKNDGLVGNEITSICEDNLTNLWIGTSEGVSKFDGIGFTNYTSKNGLTNDMVYSIYKDRDGALWFSTFGGGIVIYDGKAFKYLTKKEGLPTNNIFCVLEDKNGTYWIGTYQNGLCAYNGKNISIYTKKDGLNDNSVFCLMQDKKRNIWIGTAGLGVSIYNGQRFSSLNLKSIEKDFIGSIIQDKRGDVWIASEHGLVKFDHETYITFTEKEGLSSNKIQALCQDYEGNIWAGTLSAGVCLFKNEAIVNYTDKDGLSNNNITCLYQEGEKSYLFGTPTNGVNVFEDNIINPLTTIRELINTNILSICKDSQNNTWVGLESGGIVILERKNKTYHLKKLLRRINETDVKAATKIIKDKKGKIWIATYGSGVFCIYNEQTIQYTINNGLVDNNVLTIYEDKNGVIWIGTKSGISRFQNNSFQTFTKEDGLADNSVNSICESKSGRLFFGTFNGLSSFNNGKLQTVSLNEGLCSNYISALSADTIGNLWIGTDKGIDKIKFSDDFKITTIKHYGERDGLVGIEVNSNAMLFDKNNRLWVGTTDGLARYSMNYDYFNNVSPSVILSDIRLFYEKTDWKKIVKTVDEKTNIPIEPELSYKNNHLTFDFRALTTNDVKYTFILEGLDNDWSPLTTKTEAPYPNIPPGKDYTFKVKVVNSDGVWSKEAIVFKFSIKAPFYQTWWFYGIVLIVAIVSVVTFVNYRTKLLEREKTILENKVASRTLELKSANDQLSVAFQDIKDSIQYAKRIQEAILPLETKIKAIFKESFILFKPRDIVSGDFYWFASIEKEGIPYNIIAVADCTGHGVPGAFMSMIGNTILNEIVITKGLVEPSIILNQLHQGIRSALKQNENESRDGMDIVLCSVDIQNRKIKYAGANRPVWFVKNDGSLTEVKATKTAIGGLTDEFQTFESHEIELAKGEKTYLFSDGFADQFGGEHGKKLMTKKFKEILLEITQLPMEEQKLFLKNFIEDWSKNVEQVDDILVIGIKV